jgi:hypothetical protein
MPENEDASFHLSCAGVTVAASAANKIKKRIEVK